MAFGLGRSKPMIWAIIIAAPADHSGLVPPCRLLKPLLASPVRFRIRTATAHLLHLAANWSFAEKWCGKATRASAPTASSWRLGPRLESCTGRRELGRDRLGILEWADRRTDHPVRRGRTNRLAAKEPCLARFSCRIRRSCAILPADASEASDLSPQPTGLPFRPCFCSCLSHRAISRRAKRMRQHREVRRHSARGRRRCGSTGRLASAPEQ